MDDLALANLSPLTLLTAAVVATLTVIVLLRHGRKARRGPPRAVVPIGGVPVDLNQGMLQAREHPPRGFVSMLSVQPSDVAARSGAIPWFTRCGQPASLSVSMPITKVGTWGAALQAWGEPGREAAQLAAANQLTIWLSRNARDRFNREWNDLMPRHRARTVTPLVEQTLRPYAAAQGLDPAFLSAVEWDLLHALMENSFLDTGHRAFFFLELLTVYEAGHYPCGWNGAWPDGRLVVF
jgi:hypothetical protein